MKFSHSLTLLLVSATHALAAPTPSVPSVTLTFRDSHGTVTLRQDIPLNNLVVSIPPSPLASTADKWADFDNVWCGIGSPPGAPASTVSWDKEDVTHFSPPILVGFIRCCRGTKEKCER
ncbi:uncharacterized protein LY89DRAFT_740700 [Mollisia scopiformis]|uniref:Uncharacterized protein n=1 Tax=Mollisia scopiformis TaxID=149040 RepID=A0A132BB63_MOLSC|nr:uncharacterized protein LY89DRAFT_740700 [Mollisia scopiformis]KUJ09618.1 hypothetical protein LY89DRAFT_740700 [Mollisia scopiformis]